MYTKSCGCEYGACFCPDNSRSDKEEIDDRLESIKYFSNHMAERVKDLENLNKALRKDNTELKNVKCSVIDDLVEMKFKKVKKEQLAKNELVKKLRTKIETSLKVKPRLVTKEKLSQLLWHLFELEDSEMEYFLNQLIGEV